MNEKSTRLVMMLAVVLTVIVVVALALVASGSTVNNDNNPMKIGNENLNYSSNSSNSSNLSNTTNGGFKIKISPSEAQKIAETYVKEPGAKVGIPRLDESRGKMVYSVPIQINGTNVGEIYINAITGENMGGAGGAP